VLHTRTYSDSSLNEVRRDDAFEPAGYVLDLIRRGDSPRTEDRPCGDLLGPEQKFVARASGKNDPDSAEDDEADVQQHRPSRGSDSRETCEGDQCAGDNDHPVKQDRRCRSPCALDRLPHQ